jgi:ParB family chromosome partitioning protein
LIKDVDNKEARLLSLVENLQRDDLLPIEEAHFLKKVLLDHPELNLDKLARMLGSHKSTLSEKVQLTEVPEEIQKDLYKKGSHFTHRHWRVVSRVKDSALRLELCQKTLQEKLSVSELEKAVEAYGIKKAHRSPRGQSQQLSFENFQLFENRGTYLKLKSLNCDLAQTLPDIKQKLIEELEKAIAFIKESPELSAQEMASLNPEKPAKNSNNSSSAALGRIQQAAAQAASILSEEVYG